MHKNNPIHVNRARVSALITCFIVAACGDPAADPASPLHSGAPDAEQTNEHLALAMSALQGVEHSPVQPVTLALIREAMASHRQLAMGKYLQGRASRQFLGLWRTKTFEQGAWVDLIWVIGKQHAWHVVTAYADEQLTIPLVRWDIVRHYELESASRDTPGRYPLAWNDLASWLTPYVNDQELFKQIGLDDCELSAGVRRDVSIDNCGAPLFPFRDCALLDFVELDGEQMTFGDPRQGDRCKQRPTRHEGWSFQRVGLTTELVHRLAGK